MLTELPHLSSFNVRYTASADTLILHAILLLPFHQTLQRLSDHITRGITYESLGIGTFSSARST